MAITWPTCRTPRPINMFSVLCAVPSYVVRANVPTAQADHMPSPRSTGVADLLTSQITGYERLPNQLGGPAAARALARALAKRPSSCLDSPRRASQNAREETSSSEDPGELVVTFIVVTHDRRGDEPCDPPRCMNRARSPGREPTEIYEFPNSRSPPLTAWPNMSRRRDRGRARPRAHSLKELGTTLRRSRRRLLARAALCGRSVPRRSPDPREARAGPHARRCNIIRLC